MMNGHEHRRNAYHSHREDETPCDDLDVDMQPQDCVDRLKLAADKHVDQISAYFVGVRTSCCRPSCRQNRGGVLCRIQSGFIVVLVRMNSGESAE